MAAWLYPKDRPNDQKRIFREAKLCGVPAALLESRGLHAALSSRSLPGGRDDNYRNLVGSIFFFFSPPLHWTFQNVTSEGTSGLHVLFTSSKNRGHPRTCGRPPEAEPLLSSNGEEKKMKNEKITTANSKLCDTSLFIYTF